MGPRADRLYAVEPVGVATSRPSAGVGDEGPSRDRRRHPDGVAGHRLLDDGFVEHDDAAVGWGSGPFYCDVEGDAFLEAEGAGEETFQGVLEAVGFDLGEIAQAPEVHTEHRGAVGGRQRHRAQHGAVSTQAHGEVDAAVEKSARLRRHLRPAVERRFAVVEGDASHTSKTSCPRSSSHALACRAMTAAPGRSGWTTKAIVATAVTAPRASTGASRRGPARQEPHARRHRGRRPRHRISASGCRHGPGRGEGTRRCRPGRGGGTPWPP